MERYDIVGMLTIKNTRGEDIVFGDCSDSVAGRCMAYSSSADGRLSRVEFEKLIIYGQQWLKENPKIEEGWINIHKNERTDGPVFIHSSVYKSRGEAVNQAVLIEGHLATIPISYHKGQGLEEEVE